jgi:hypothetical protein
MYVAKTRRDFESYFRREILPQIRVMFESDGLVDNPARHETWNNQIDVMIRNGELPPRAAEWRCPW